MMPRLDINETIDQLAMANRMCWYVHMLIWDNGHVLKMALECEVEGQRKKRRSNRRWTQIKEKAWLL